jgi:hypothetical protein
MFCDQCGSGIPSKQSRFCAACGAPVAGSISDAREDAVGYAGLVSGIVLIIAGALILLWTQRDRSLWGPGTDYSNAQPGDLLCPDMTYAECQAEKYHAEQWWNGIQTGLTIRTSIAILCAIAGLALVVGIMIARRRRRVGS